jgi:stage III sporulation protein AA
MSDLTLNRIKEVINYISPEIRLALLKISEISLAQIEEIRLRTGCPVTIAGTNIRFLITDGRLSENAESAVIVTQSMLQRTIERMCQSSLYSLQNELRSGFLTLSGGHRVGVCGKTVVENGNVARVVDISSLNIRIAKEIIGAADKIISYIAEKDIQNTLIISPPSCGKTTLLRDIARQLAGEKYGYRVGIVDERSEIAAMYRGEAQNDVGILSDVYDACPKDEGMIMLLRAMAPDVIITDEIGNVEDEAAIMRVINAGVKIICSAHGFDRADVLRREAVGSLIRDGIFERIFVLSRKEGAGTIERMY